MSFESREVSRALGKPVHLFTFARQGLHWHYCTGVRPFTYGATTWLPAPIRRSEIRETFEHAKDPITITLAYLRDPVAAAAASAPVTQPLGDNWFPYIPHDPIHVSCLAAHVGEDSPPAAEWLGVVSGQKFGDVELELTCEPGFILARAREQGPKFQRGCWKSVYSTGLRGCNLDPEPLAVAATLEAIDGLTLTSSAFSTSTLNLAGGWFEWVRGDGLVERRSIMAHTDDVIVLLYGAADLEVDLEGTAYPGCPQTWSACEARANTINYGGAIYKPVTDPLPQSMSWG